MSRRRELSAAARREAARTEAERIQRAQRRRRGLVIGSVVLLLAAIVLASFIIWKGSQVSYLDDVERAPQGADTSGGIPVAADGTAGIAGTAPRLDLYLDVQSPESVAFWRAQGESLQLLNAEGTISLWVHLVGFVDGGAKGASTRAGEAAVVVADRAPQSFLPFLDAELDMRAEGAEKLNDPDLEQLALGVGISQDVVDRFTDRLFDDWFLAATDQAVRDGVETTPTLLLEGERLTADWAVDGALEDAVGAARAG
jgi:hypothetical protein